MKNFLTFLLTFLGTESVREVLMDLAGELASRTDNTIDDQIVEVFHHLVYGRKDAAKNKLERL